jgi:hypothetical protein
LWNAGRVGLVLAVALWSLPSLPQRGLALETQAGMQLQTMAGRPLATLAGMDLAFDQAVAHELVVRDRRGPVPGIYAVPTSRGEPRLVLRTPRLAQYMMWGG